MSYSYRIDEKLRQVEIVNADGVVEPSSTWKFDDFDSLDDDYWDLLRQGARGSDYVCSVVVARDELIDRGLIAGEFEYKDREPPP